MTLMTAAAFHGILPRKTCGCDLLCRHAWDAEAAACTARPARLGPRRLPAETVGVAYTYWWDDTQPMAPDVGFPRDMLCFEDTSLPPLRGRVSRCTTPRPPGRQ